MLASYRYRGHIIRFDVEQNPDTLYWEAKGVIELIEGRSPHTFILSGAINTFKWMQYSEKNQCPASTSGLTASLDQPDRARSKSSRTVWPHEASRFLQPIYLYWLGIRLNDSDSKCLV